MAKRLSPKHDETTRDKIQTSQLVNRLNKNAMGELGEREMTSGQIRSAEILLKKTLPDLSAIEQSFDPETVDALAELMSLVRNSSRGIPRDS